MFIGLFFFLLVIQHEKGGCRYYNSSTSIKFFPCSLSKKAYSSLCFCLRIPLSFSIFFSASDRNCDTFKMMTFPLCLHVFLSRYFTNNKIHRNCWEFFFDDPITNSSPSYERGKWRKGIRGRLRVFGDVGGRYFFFGNCGHANCAEWRIKMMIMSQTSYQIFLTRFFPNGEWGRGGGRAGGRWVEAISWKMMAVRCFRNLIFQSDFDNVS